MSKVFFNQARNLSKEKVVNEIKQFFSRENIKRQLKAMVGYLIPGRKVDFKLNIGGGSYTDSKVVVVGLPELLFNRSKEEIFMALMALVGHESQHVVSSNFEGFVAFQEEVAKYLKDKHDIPKGVSQKIAHGIANSIEDGRIEKILCNKRPGYLKKIQFLNLLFWEEQPVTGDNELGEFLYSITIQSVTGLDPKGFQEVYAGSELEENLRKVRPFIIKGINARTSDECFHCCWSVLTEVEDYWVKLIKDQIKKDQDLFDKMQSMPDFNNSEESEENNSGSGGASCHFTPEDMDEDKKNSDKKNKKKDNKNGSKEDDKESQDKKKGEKDGSEGESSKSKDKGSEDGDKDQEDQEDQDEQGSGSGKDDEKEEDNDQGSSGSDGDKSEDDDSDSTEQGEDGKDGEDSPDDSESRRDTHKGEDQGIEEQSMKEEDIRSLFDGIKDELMDETEEKFKEADRQDRIDQKKIDQEATLTSKEKAELNSKYSSESFSERKGFPLNHSLPPDVKKEGANFRKEVERIFKNKQAYDLRSQPKGVLNGNDLWKIGMRDYNVFTKKGTASQSDYVAYVLKDGSGSMADDRKDVYATYACSVIEEGLKGIIPLKITNFNAGYGSVNHYQIKGFGEEDKTTNYSYNFLNAIKANSGNKDGYSIRVATKELLRRNERDKILFVLSDGLPSVYANARAGMDDVKEAVKEARKNGIIVIAILFGSTSFREDSIELYKEMYEKNIISCAPGDISSQLTKTLKKIIVR